MSAAIRALAFQPYDRRPEETKQGFVYYNGNAKDFHFWNFKTELRMQTTKEDEFATSAFRLVESLQGDAMRIAHDIGVDALIKADRSGIKLLMDKMRAHVFPIVKEKVKALYREGHREGGGTLSRHRGETMQHYIHRRQQWFDMLKSFDNSVVLSDELLGELLLVNAGISELDRKLILTITGNKTPFKGVADALMVHHSQIHLKHRSSDDKKERRPFHRRKDHQRKPYRKGGSKRFNAYVTEEGSSCSFSDNSDASNDPADDVGSAASQASEAADAEAAGDAYAATRG